MSRKSRVPSRAIYNTPPLCPKTSVRRLPWEHREPTPWPLRHWALGWQRGGTGDFEYRSFTLSLSLSLPLFLLVSPPSCRGRKGRGRGRVHQEVPGKAARSRGHSPAASKHISDRKLVDTQGRTRDFGFQSFYTVTLFSGAPGMGCWPDVPREPASRRRGWRDAGSDPRESICSSWGDRETDLSRQRLLCDFWTLLGDDPAAAAFWGRISL